MGIMGVLIMMCDNTLCVYWTDNVCSLTDIYLDDRGCCQECLWISASDQQLEKMREKTLKAYERRYDRWD